MWLRYGEWSLLWLMYRVYILYNLKHVQWQLCFGNLLIRFVFFMSYILCPWQCDRNTVQGFPLILFRSCTPRDVTISSIRTKLPGVKGKCTHSNSADIDCSTWQRRAATLLPSSLPLSRSSALPMSRIWTPDGFKAWWRSCVSSLVRGFPARTDPLTTCFYLMKKPFLSSPAWSSTSFMFNLELNRTIRQRMKTPISTSQCADSAPRFLTYWLWMNDQSRYSNYFPYILGIFYLKAPVCSDFKVDGNGA